MQIPEHVPWKSTGRSLGSGGQGQVHLVRHQSQPDGPDYALKILRNTESSQARERFRREIEVVKQLRAPSIIQIFDHSNVEDDFQYYLMEFHEGARTLASIIFSEDNPYHGDIDRCLDLFENIIVAIGVCEAASPQIIHRDINPRNILVLPDDTIRIIDFGVCQFDDGVMITLIDENVGARNYTSPECESGSDASIGVHSDIYSAAKVLWSAITSRQAFAREEPVFNGRSMSKMFPESPECWQLVYVFEGTIRANPTNRCRNSNEVLGLIREVRHLVKGGFPPVKRIRAHCPSCGRRSVREYDKGYLIFGNPNPPGVKSLICDSCGFVFVRNTDVWEQSIERLQGLG